MSDDGLTFEKLASRLDTMDQASVETTDATTRWLSIGASVAPMALLATSWLFAGTASAVLVLLAVLLQWACLITLIVRITRQAPRAYRFAHQDFARDMDE